MYVRTSAGLRTGGHQRLRWQWIHSGGGRIRRRVCRHILHEHMHPGRNLAAGITKQRASESCSLCSCCSARAAGLCATRGCVTLHKHRNESVLLYFTVIADLSQLGYTDERHGGGNLTLRLIRSRCHCCSIARWWASLMNAVSAPARSSTRIMPALPRACAQHSAVRPSAPTAVTSAFTVSSSCRAFPRLRRQI